LHNSQRTLLRLHFGDDASTEKAIRACRPFARLRQVILDRRRARGSRVESSDARFCGKSGGSISNGRLSLCPGSSGSSREKAGTAATIMPRIMSHRLMGGTIS
jgi:hypothetical protein